MPLWRRGLWEQRPPITDITGITECPSELIQIVGGQGKGREGQIGAFGGSSQLGSSVLRDAWGSTVQGDQTVLGVKPGSVLFKPQILNRL